VQVYRLRRRLERDPLRKSYTDLAIAPLDGRFDEALELYEASDSARAAAARARTKAAARRPATASV
jgi:hypothetical protein